MNPLIAQAKNVVFDVGQVLLSFEPERILPLMLTEEERRVITAPAIVETPMWVQLDAGTVTDEETARYSARLAGDESLWPAVLRMIRGFHEYMDVLPPATLIPQLHAEGKRVYVLSNYNDQTFARAAQRFSAVFSQMDGMVISGREHLLKPDERIYRLLLECYGLKAEECVFIDDRPENIEAARRVGMQGIVYTGMDALA